MDLSIFYAIAAGGLIAVVFLVQISRYIRRILQDSIIAFLFRHAVYPLCVSRHTLLGPWSRGMVLIQVIYWTTTLFFSCFRIRSSSEAASRTGVLSLINLVPLYFGFQLSFVADILGVSIRLWRQLHGTLGVMAAVLALVHAGISITTDRRVIQGYKGLYTILVSFTGSGRSVAN